MEVLSLAAVYKLSCLSALDGWKLAFEGYLKNQIAEGHIFLFKKGLPSKKLSYFVGLIPCKWHLVVFQIQSSEPRQKALRRRGFDWWHVSHGGAR